MKNSTAVILLPLVAFFMFFSGTSYAISAASLTGLSINTQPLNDSICHSGSLSVFYRCNPLEFSATSTGPAVVQHQLQIRAIDANCQPNLQLLNYTSGWQPNMPLPGLDLRNLTDAAGNSLNNFQGTIVEITLSIEQPGGIISSLTRYLKVYAPVPALINLQTMQQQSNLYQSGSQNIYQPNAVAHHSVGYRVFNSTGNIEWFTTQVEEVDHAGNVLQQLFTRTDNASGSSELTYVSLNGFCVDSSVWGFDPTVTLPNYPACYSPANNPGYQGFFSYNNGQLGINKLYKLTVTVGNECNSASNWSYFHFSGVINSLTDQVADPLQVLVYPNPVQMYLSVQLKGKSEEKFRVELIDALGRIVKAPVPLISEAGELSQAQLDVSALTPGIYFYRIYSENNQLTGCFVKE